MKHCIEGSEAVAQAVNNCRPDVISAYPITPQTHIVEELALLKANGHANYEYILADSEFAAASIVLGASATGGRTYTATSSQGLLYMTEVIFDIAGMRLPVIMTVANRAISAPINIWNDQQDSMTVRDSGWIMLYAKDNQSAVDLHLLAYKLAEKLKLPAMINMDGFVLTHTVEPIDIPSVSDTKKFLPSYKPEVGQILDTKNPVTLGSFVTPQYYQEIRFDLHSDLLRAKELFTKEAIKFNKIFHRQHDLVEYYGTAKPDSVIITIGSVFGTIQDVVDELNNRGQKVGVFHLTCFRPFPDEQIVEKLSKIKSIAVLEKDISLGSSAGLDMEIRRALFNKNKSTVTSFVYGLGGRDITPEYIREIFKQIKQ